MHEASGTMVGPVDPYRVIVDMRDRIAAGGTILEETEVRLGDVAAKDLTYLTDLPPYGKAQIRNRIVFHDRKVYQVMATRTLDAVALAPDIDRFVESFAITDGKVIDPLANAGIGSDSPITVHKVGAGSADASGWYPAHSASGRFSVSLPAPYLDGDIDAGRDTGRPEVDVHMHMLVATRDSDHVKFFASCNASPQSPQEAVRYMVSSIKGATAKEIELHGNPAADLTTGHARMRVIGLPGRVCAMVVEPMEKATPLPEADAQKMFDSFAADP